MSNKFSFDDPLPAIIYWDTSFVDAYLIREPSTPYHSACRDFRERLGRENVLSVLSDFVYNEVAFRNEN